MRYAASLGQYIYNKRSNSKVCLGVLPKATNYNCNVLSVNCEQDRSLKFFVVKNHLRNHSLPTAVFLAVVLLDHVTCSTRPSQRSKYTEGVDGTCADALPSRD